MTRLAHALALGLALVVAWWCTDALGPFAFAALWFGGPFAVGWGVAEWGVPHRRLARVLLVVDGLALLLYAVLSYVLSTLRGSPFDGVLLFMVAPVHAVALVAAMLVTAPDEAPVGSPVPTLPP